MERQQQQNHECENPEHPPFARSVLLLQLLFPSPELKPPFFLPPHPLLLAAPHLLCIFPSALMVLSPVALIHALMPIPVALVVVLLAAFVVLSLFALVAEDLIRLSDLHELLSLQDQKKSAFRRGPPKMDHVR